MILINKKSNLILIAAMGLLLANILAIGLLANKVGIIDLSQSQNAFSRLLATHVEVAILIWLPSITLVVWMRIANIADKISNRYAFIIALCTSLLILTGLFSSASVTLSDYFPVIQQPLFIFAMLGICLTMISAAIIILIRMKVCSHWIGILSTLTTLVAMVLLTLGLAFSVFDNWEHASYLFWVSGHVYQLALVYTLCLFWLGASHPQQKFSFALKIIWSLPLLVHVLAIVLSIANVDHMISKNIFTAVMEFCSWWPVIFCANRALKTANSDTKNALILSMGLFVLAIIFGFLIKPSTLIIPAHYHAVLSALNVGAFYYLLTAKVLSSNRQVLAYGVGMALLASGIGVAGILGEARKIATSISWTDFSSIALVIASIGGIIALIASLMIAISLIKMNPLSRSAVTTFISKGYINNGQ